MTIIAERVRAGRASDTKAMTARAAALRASGRSVITLSQGEPDFETPLHVREAAHRAIDRGMTRYTPVPGIEPLRVAVADKLLRDNSLRVAPDDVIVSCGAKQVIFHALLASLEPGDEVIIPTPCWVSYPEMVKLAGGTPVPVATVQTRFKLTPSLLAAALTNRTKWLVINSPCNPTGVVYTATELRALAEVLERHPDVWVLSDDIYEKLIYDDAPFATMAAVAPSLAPRTLTVNGLSKSHAMTGWRVGYGAGPTELIKAMTLIQGQTSSHTSSISQHAAVEALAGDESFLTEFRGEYRRRRDLVAEMLNAVPGLCADRPAGAFYVFVSCEGLIGSTTPSGARLASDADVAAHLLDEAGVAVVPGSGFLASPFFRVSFASSIDTLREGCRRIDESCRRLRRAEP